MCERAELDVQIVPVQWACEQCGAADRARTAAALSGRVNSPARLIAGDEIILDRIEMEVP